MCLLAEPQSLQQCGCLNQTCTVTTPAETAVEISDISQAPLPEGELDICCEYGAHVLKTFIKFNKYIRCGFCFKTGPTPSAWGHSVRTRPACGPNELEVLVPLRQWNKAASAHLTSVAFSSILVQLPDLTI